MASITGKWIYCVGEDGIVYTFDTAGGQLENILQVSDREVIGISHHPLRSQLMTITDDGQLKLWKP
jgi:WD40 repeat-containing protein SMU1